jgi:hypothetical protein
MSLFETITADIHAAIDTAGTEPISPTTIALQLQHRYAPRRLVAPIAYTSLEHLKQMTRSVLRRRFDKTDLPDPDQGELFSGDLQERYPVPTPAGYDPLYKRLEDLTEPELVWNERRLGKSADALQAHRRALAAYRLQRFSGVANDTAPGKSAA